MRYRALSFLLFLLLAGCRIPNNSAPSVDLDILSEVTDHGVTWTFSKPTQVGCFITGEYYVVGPTTIIDISPLPENDMNGSVLNIPPVQYQSGFDYRTEADRYDPNLRAQLPVELNPGDSLASSISLEEPGLIENWLREGNGEYGLSPVKSISILTCLEQAVPEDAFRPSYADTSNKIYRLNSVNRDLLPVLSSPVSLDTEYMQMFADRIVRPWVDNVLYEFDAQVEYMPMYGRETGRVMGIVSLILMLDLDGEQEELQETLLIGMLQKGIDLWGLVREGYPGWIAHGGHGSGRKWPIIFAGIMFEDPEMASPSVTFPGVQFGEDMMTAYESEVVGGGPVWWNGSTVVYTGHMGIWNGVAVSDEPGWGPYEHIDPAGWVNPVGEAYRRCCTSNAWVGQALAARLMDAVGCWNHDAFFDYVDRWMDPAGDEDYTNYIYNATGGEMDFRADWAQHGQTFDSFIDDVWEACRW